jgi:hypothetical protein
VAGLVEGERQALKKPITKARKDESTKKKKEDQGLAYSVFHFVFSSFRAFVIEFSAMPPRPFISVRRFVAFGPQSC